MDDVEDINLKASLNGQTSNIRSARASLNGAYKQHMIGKLNTTTRFIVYLTFLSLHVYKLGHGTESLANPENYGILETHNLGLANVY